MNIYAPFRYEEFEDTKFRVVTRICKSKKNRQHVQWPEEIGQMFATTQRQDRGVLQTIMTYNICYRHASKTPSIKTGRNNIT